MNIVRKCVAWNQARYDQIIDLTLAARLLAEETEELCTADSIIERLDAIGDICFVAIGILWKSGLSVKLIEDMLNLEGEKFATADALTLVNMQVTFEVRIADYTDTDEAYLACLLAINALFSSALFLRSFGLQAEFYNVIDAICDSNNTKVVKGKTKPSVKANIDKGTDFVPPTAALERIIAKYTTTQTLN